MGMVELALIGKLKKTKANQSTTYTKIEVDNLISPLAKYYAQETAPTSVNPGDIWFNQTNGKTYIRQIDINDTEIWIDLNGGSTNIFLPTLKESDLIQVTDINTNTFDFVYVTQFIQVFVNRVKLRKSEFTAINGSSITLNISLELNDEIEFVTLEINEGNTSAPTLKESDLIQVTDINTNTYNFVYSSRFLQVFVNRLKLRKSEFTAINGSSITLNISLELNDEIEFITLETI